MVQPVVVYPARSLERKGVDVCVEIVADAETTSVEGMLPGTGMSKVTLLKWLDGRLECTARRWTQGGRHKAQNGYIGSCGHQENVSLTYATYSTWDTWLTPLISLFLTCGY